MDVEDQLVLEASEQRGQRPQNQEDQKEDYRGKKRTYHKATSIKQFRM